jgi:hypothetical protein
MANDPNQGSQIITANSRTIFDRFKEVGSALGELSTSVAEGTSKLIEGTKAGQKAAEIGGKVFDGAKEIGKGLSDATGKIGANLSGEEAHTKMQELVMQQTRYNDILATRLAEALDRIDKLEQQVERLSRGRP